MGPKAVLIKGGHFGSASDAEFTDWLALPDEPLIALKQPGVKTSNNHGTGCTLSAAIATYLGLGLGIRDAIVHAQKFLNHCLRHGYAPGLGGGSAEPRFMDCQAGLANSFSGREKRGRPHAVAPGTPVLVFSFFRRVACPAFSGDSVSGIRAFYRLRERRLAFHANMFYLFLL